MIVSVDTLAGAKMFARLKEPDMIPYDLVIFDEAHKLSADRGNDRGRKAHTRTNLSSHLSASRSAIANVRPRQQGEPARKRRPARSLKIQKKNCVNRVVVNVREDRET